MAIGSQTRRLSIWERTPFTPPPLHSAAPLKGAVSLSFFYDTTEITQGMTEILAYGTAVIVEPKLEVADRDEWHTA
ncbi:MAG: hypothetical protein MI924_24235 [Chloroflexales bacterium]|nr:hypothetical protein [Chloroflexales bacterium]